MQKIIRTGHSAALTVPAEFFNALNLRIGDHAEMTADYITGAITYKFQEVRQLRLDTQEKTPNRHGHKAKNLPRKKQKNE